MDLNVKRMVAAMVAMALVISAKAPRRTRSTSRGQ